MASNRHTRINFAIALIQSQLVVILVVERECWMARNNQRDLPVDESSVTSTFIFFYTHPFVVLSSRIHDLTQE